MKEENLKRAWELIVILFGLILVALGLNLFLIPNKIAAGGVSGIGIVLFHLFKIPVGMSMLAMNLVLFALGFHFLGKGFGWKSIWATIMLSVLTDFFTYIIPTGNFTDDLMIATIFGNLMTGAGMAVIFNQDASTGGTDILAKLTNHFTSFDVGKSLLIYDFGIGIAAGITLHSTQVGMYSLLGILINTFAIDAFLGAVTIKKQVWIISDKADEINRLITNDLQRGVTIFNAIGGYTGENRKVIMTVVRLRQAGSIKRLVKNVDPKAFVIIGSANEVVGKGFRQN